MKNYLFFLLVALMLGSQSNVFAGDPIREYNENGYSIAEVKAFAVENSALATSWRKELLSIVNSALVNAGENLVLNEKNLYWIMDHVQYERREIRNFSNSKRVGNNIVFFSENIFDGMVAVFRYGKCEVIIFKTICLNLLKVSSGSIASTVPAQVDPTTGGRKGSVYLIDTLHKTVNIYDTIVYSTTVYDDQYRYGDGSSYTYYPYAEPVWYFAWSSWPTFRYDNYYSFREYNCCCNFYTDYYHQEINYDYHTYYGTRTELPSGRGYDPVPPSGGRGYDPSDPNAYTRNTGRGSDPDFKSAVRTVERTIHSGFNNSVRSRNQTRSFSQPTSTRSSGFSPARSFNNQRSVNNSGGVSRSYGETRTR